MSEGQQGWGLGGAGPVRKGAVHRAGEEGGCLQSGWERLHRGCWAGPQGLQAWAAGSSPPGRQ